MDETNLDRFFWGLGRFVGLCAILYVEYMRYMLCEIYEETLEGPTHEPIAYLRVMLGLFSLGLQLFNYLDGFMVTMLKISCFLVKRSSRMARLLIWALQPLVMNIFLPSLCALQTFHLLFMYYYVSPGVISELGRLIMSALGWSTPSDSCEGVKVYRAANGTFHSTEM